MIVKNLQVFQKKHQVTGKQISSNLTIGEKSAKSANQLAA